MTELAEITTEIDPASLALATARAEIDSQIATAKAFPRNVKKSFDKCLAQATFSPSVAQKCVYRLPRGGQTIEGPSVHLAEIVANAWGNVRFGARVVEEGATSIVVQGFAHDLESNTSFSSEVRVRITNKQGQRYNDDMITMAANAGQSKALRNAIFRVVPRVFIDEIVEKCKATIEKDGPSLSEQWGRAVKYGADQWGLQPAQILELVDKQTVSELTYDDLLTIRSVYEELKSDKEKFAEYFPAAKSRTDSVKNRIAAKQSEAKQPEPPKGELFNSQTDTSAIKG
jgi:hypothetical protein